MHFVKTIVTCDKTCLNGKALSGITQVHPLGRNLSPCRLQVNKVMLTVFWDLQGPIIYCDYLEHQRTINNQYYSDMLENKIRPAI